MLNVPGDDVHSGNTYGTIGGRLAGRDAVPDATNFGLFDKVTADDGSDGGEVQSASQAFGGGVGFGVGFA